MTNEIAIWYFKSNASPWPNISTTDSNPIEWAKYRDVEIDLIEEAYKEKKSSVLLDRYRIDFNHFIQINIKDETKQRPIKRETLTNRNECLRANRFGSALSVDSPSSTVLGSFDSWCPFLTAWLNSPSGKRSVLDFSKCIQACAEGIVREAAVHGSHSNTEAAHMAERILLCLKKSRVEASIQCINLYTKDSFLYSVLNEALRKHDRSKLETLGPLCQLIRSYSRIAQDYIGTVYRGTELSHTDIQLYKQHIGEWKTWQAYTSTSKDRLMAEMFGGTLFIIDITDIKLSAPRAYDIAHLSQYPEEKEVLIPAGVSFQILSVEQDPSQKTIIHVRI